MTKQFITIGSDAVEHITDPNEQRDRLVYIMDEVASLLGGLRGDQIPILPHYVEMHHVDLKNTIPDNSGFLESVNADIAAVLNVPRVAAGQEKGSTFAATFNANMWSVSAMKRLQGVVEQGIQELFMRHLALQGIEAEPRHIPRLMFHPIEDESRFDKMRRATMGYDAGVITLNQALDILDMPSIGKEGDERKEDGSADQGQLPRQNEQEDNVTDKPKNERENNSSGGGNE